MSNELKNTEFFENVVTMIEKAHSFIGRTVDVTKCITYFEIGRRIVEEEQAGDARAKYGDKLLLELSMYLTQRVGKGFSVTNLKYARKFYQVYASEKGQALSDPLVGKRISKKSQALPDLFGGEKNLSIEGLPFTLSWSHYLVLMRIKNDDERRFYEIEATEQQWDYRFLQRQYNSSLYERLALSRNKEEVKKLANKGQEISKPSDLLKNPLSLEFLGLESHPNYSESDLEQALIDNLQKFLLELGKGFLFEARQKRFTFDEDHFRVDLVFYNRLLRCYVIIDLKTEKIKHQDLGQMLMYVNYFDRYVKTDKEEPTIGILLCKEKNDSVVEMTLPENSNIYASEYNLYLPDKETLQRKLAEWAEEFEEQQELLALGKSDDENGE